MAPFGPFAADRRVAVAVSGGADSMALALLLSGWGRPEALVVDHGLRAGSAAEAQRAVERLTRFGVPSRVLSLGLVRGAALAERARVARYAALTEACAAAGMSDLLVGHHAQDQIETFMLRQARGSGPAGLAGMAGVVHQNRVRVLRPLLTVMPDRLRATLRGNGVAWSEDPSNQDPATPRALLRERFQSGDAPDLAALRSAASQYGTLRHDAEQAVANELGAVASLHPEGFAHVVAARLSPGALSALVWMVSGRVHPPSPAAVARLAMALRPGTLHGVLVAPAGRLGAGWLIVREATAGAMPALAGALWDGRYRLHGDAPKGAVIEALGSASRFRRASPLPAVVLRTLPALRLDGALLAVPHLNYLDIETCGMVAFTLEPERTAGCSPFRPT